MNSLSKSRRLLSMGLALSFSALLLAPSAFADAKVGEPAPTFTLKDVEAKEHSLEAYKGKWVVLEWVNYDCPFVKKHYNSGNMQKLQSEAKTKEVVWLAINSSAPGKQGHFPYAKLVERIAKEKAEHSAYLLDTDGAVGQRYGAKTTPHMYIIDPEGQLVYNGAIDDKATTKAKDVEGAKNYVAAALEAGMSGKVVEVSATQPYGCSVKY